MLEQLPLDTIDLDALTEIIKSVVLQVVSVLQSVVFSWGDLAFTAWEFLLACFVVSVLCFALLRDRGGDDD